MRGVKAMPILAAELNAQAGEFVFDLAKDEQVTLNPKRSGAGTFVKAGAGYYVFQIRIIPSAEITEWITASWQSRIQQQSQVQKRFLHKRWHITIRFQQHRTGEL
ncbi:peptidase S6 IgA endopeptidase [Actinobacillus equuli]|nr:peptidase S6 IgA endopeptidase [Actinobacillus equuli]